MISLHRPHKQCVESGVAVCAENGLYYCASLFGKKMEEYALETVADDYLAEVKIGGYDVCHGVFFHDTNGKYCGL